jgi:ABC-type polysaccharide/polyol phosphate transport system ATPase subunit
MSCDTPASPVSETETGLSEVGPAIDVRQVSKVFNVYHQPIDRLKQALFRGRRTFYTSFAALNDVTFTVPLHQTIGIIGENGSGKSTLLQIISGLLMPSAGSVAVDGRVSALLELGAGFNPAFTGRENVYMNAAILGLSREEVDERYDEIVRFSGLEEFMERPVETYSSGMFVRLAFSVAVCVDPDILIVDEALAVGDEAFQRKCFARIEEMQERGATILPELLSQSRVEYTPAGARIHAVRVETLESQPLNVLLRGRRYVFAYDVSFDVDAEGVLFGMLIKTQTGLELGGRASFSRRERFPDYAAGATVTLRYEFDCALTVGTYFMNAGVSSLIDGDRRSLHRIMDAFMFQVAPDGDDTLNGVVDFDIRVSVEQDRG